MLTRRQRKHAKEMKIGILLLLLLTVVNISILSICVKEKETIRNVETEINKTHYAIEEALQQTNDKLNELDTIKQCATAYDLPLEVVVALMKVESNFNPNAVSKANCKGLMQISPIHNVADVLDIKQNCEFGCSYLSKLIAESNNLHEALTKYNRGTSGYYNYLKKYGTEISAYSEKIIKYLNGITVEDK